MDKIANRDKKNFHSAADQCKTTEKSIKFHQQQQKNRLVRATFSFNATFVVSDFIAQHYY